MHNALVGLNGKACAPAHCRAWGWGMLWASLLLIAIGGVGLGGCSELLDEDYAVAAEAQHAPRLPVPNRALLTPPRPPNCEGKPASSGGDSPYYAGEDVAALRTKLEADKECYRKAELKTRERLKQLQAATAEMVRGLQRLEQDDP
jgi:hypothetical protein